MSKALGNYMKRARESAGLTQNGVAEKLCLSCGQFISNMERGLADPPMDRLVVIAKMYKLDRKEFAAQLVQEHEKRIHRKLRLR